MSLGPKAFFTSSYLVRISPQSIEPKMSLTKNEASNRRRPTRFFFVFVIDVA